MAEPTKRALIVDDDAAVRNLLCTTLSLRGVGADAASDGDEAIGALREHGYSVVLLDLFMPRLDGFAVIDWLVAHRPSPQPPPVLIVMTGAQQDTLEALDSQAVHGIIRKPFDAEELSDLVVACMEVKSRTPFGTMALATMVSGAPLLAWLDRFRA